MTNAMSIYNCLLLSVAVVVLLIVNILNERNTKSMMFLYFKFCYLAEKFNFKKCEVFCTLNVV